MEADNDMEPLHEPIADHNTEPMHEPIAFHVTFRLLDSRVIAPTPEDRRTVARSILKLWRGTRLLCFNVPDTHVHVEHAESEDVGAQLVRRTKLSIARQLRLLVGFASTEPQPVSDQLHLYRAFDYILRQQPRHGLAWDPYHEASNLADLLGMRRIGGYTAKTMRQLLPLVDRQLLLRLLGVSELTEAAGPAVHIIFAARAASGLDDLRRRTPAVRAVWRAVLATTEGQLPVGQIAELLGISRKTLQRIRAKAPDPAIVRAIRLQLGLRQVKAAQPLGAFTKTTERHHRTPGVS